MDLVELLRKGLSAAEAIDYYYVIIEDRTQSEWAAVRGVNQQAVSQNVGKAKCKLHDDC